MAGRRRGRTGRGWDAAPPRPRPARSPREGGQPGRSGRLPGSQPPDEGGPAAGGAAGPDEPAAGEATPSREEFAERARQICLRQLSVRPRTRAELARALRRHDIPEDVATEVLERYREVGMIDDAAFARAWVESRHRERGLAGRALSRELRQRGVDPELAGEALSQLDQQTEEETARALAARKLRTTRGDPATVLRRLVGVLARKGYPPGLAYRVVRDVLAEHEQTAEYAADLDIDAMADAAVGDESEQAGPADPDPRI